MRNVVIRSAAIVTLLAVLLAAPSALGPIGSLAWSIAWCLAFAGGVIFFAGAGFAFVLSAVIGLTLLFPLAVLLAIGRPVYGSLFAAAAAIGSSVSGNPVTVGLQLLLPSAITAVAVRALLRVASVRQAKGRSRAGRP